jgi:hypothetical protein
MNVIFDSVDILINNSGVLATNASIRSRDRIVPIQSIGRVTPVNHVRAGALEHDLSFSYALQLDHEPNFGIVSGLKNSLNLTGYDPIIVEIGGITGSCFLDSFGFSIQPNNTVMANVSFKSYENLSGTFQEKAFSGNYGSLSNIGHGWSTYLTHRESYFDAPIFSLNYGFKANWEPQYSLNSQGPVQVTYLGGEENLSILQDEYTTINFSGLETSMSIFDFSTNTGLDMVSLDIVGTSEYDKPLNPSTGNQTRIVLDLSGMFLENSSVRASLNDFMKNSLNFVKYN